jgi:LuxR family maltose regulon positive regulatory protein
VIKKHTVIRRRYLHHGLLLYNGNKEGVFRIGQKYKPGLYLMDKQTPVTLPQICAPRAELMRYFDKAAEIQYIYIHAPAGYGKTVSALLWLQKTNRKPAWISLDAYDNAPVLFYRLLCISLLALIPHDEELLLKIKSAAFGAEPVENTIDLITRLAYEEGPYALVLDDFQLITNEEIKKSLPYVLKRLPLSVTVLILSRNGLPGEFAFLPDQRKLSVIDSSVLAFSRDEIRRHFAGYGLFITKDEADRIYAYTEGWAIALNAVAASGQYNLMEQNPSRFFSSFIETTIWSRLEVPVREFLLKTSVPDKFTEALCRYLTEDPGCGSILAELVGSNINISLMGDEYRYHNLFLEFLREKLDQSTLDKAALNKRVAEYFLQKGDFLTAKTYAVKSRDVSCIAQSVRSFFSLKTFSIDEYIEFHKLYGIHALPEMICEKSPILYVPRIFYAYASGDAESVSRYFDRLYPLIPRIAEEQPEVLEHVNSMIMLDCRIRLSELPSVAGNLPEITRESENLQSPTFTLQLPFLHRCVRDFYELTDSGLRGRIHGFSAGIIKQNVDIMFGGAEAGLLLEQNRLPEALAVAVNLKKSLSGGMSPEFVYGVYVLAAEIALRMRRKQQYEALLKEAKEYIAGQGSQYLLKNLQAYATRELIENGDKAAAEKWLQNYFVDDGSFGTLYKIFRNFTTVRAYILLGMHAKAFDALRSIKALADRFDRLLDAAEADTLLSVLEWAAGKKKEARNRLLNAIGRLLPHGFVRPVANQGKAVLPILAAVSRQLEKEDGQTGGLAKFVREIYVLAYEQAKHTKGIAGQPGHSAAVRLSPRQKRVLELLSKGYKNAEIVTETGLSLNTIRTHTKLVYQKLEVNSAAEAVARARQLGVIQ